MARIKAGTSDVKTKQRPALSPEAREEQMIAYAVDLAEKQLIEGTASSQVITHYLKLGTQRERIEREILEKQKMLIEAKTEAIQSAKITEDLVRDAIKAFKAYSGNDEDDDVDEDLKML